MSIHSVGSGLPATTAQPQLIRQPRNEAAARATVAGAPPADQATDALPVEAPPGTDPAIWAVLTTEERQFFARSSALGPITYGRVATPKPAVPVGGRLDVRA
jgi:hypothetical protein